MIIVVEGISASGKTTWCFQHGSRCTIAENGPFHGLPDRKKAPAVAARFWADRNAERWHAALKMESKSGLAICDTDPLKLHYIWTMWQIGEALESDWLLELEATRATIVAGKLGFADCYLVGLIKPQIARQRAQADTSRRRRRIDIHSRLQPALAVWYSALDKALPGRVSFEFPNELPSPAHLENRYDVSAFDKLVRNLKYNENY